MSDTVQAMAALVDSIRAARTVERAELTEEQRTALSILDDGGFVFTTPYTVVRCERAGVSFEGIPIRTSEHCAPDTFYVMRQRDALHDFSLLEE